MSDVFFARAVLIQELQGRCVRYSTDDESTIIVTRSEDLNVVLPASGNGPSIYLDIPLSAIDCVVVATLDEPSQLSPTVDRMVVALSIHVSSSASSCYLNAVRCHTRSVEIAFDNLDAANRLKTALMVDKHLDTEEQRFSQSVKKIDVSQAQGHEMEFFAVSDDNLQGMDHLGATASSLDKLTLNRTAPEDLLVSQAAKEINVSEANVDEMDISAVEDGCLKSSDLIATATKAIALPPQGTSPEQSPSMRVGVNQPQHSQLRGWKEPQDVPHIGPPSTLCGQAIYGSPETSVHPEAPIEERCYTTARTLEVTSQPDSKTPVQRPGEKQPADNGPEITKLPAGLSNQHAMEEDSRPKVDGRLPENDHDHASLYDASPRASQPESRPAKPLREKLPKTPQWQHPAKDDDGSSNGHPNVGPSRSGQFVPKKLTQRMTNAECDIGAESSTAVRPDRVPPVKKSTIPEALRNTNSKRKIPQSGKRKPKGHDESKQQAKEQGRSSKSKTDANHTIGIIDEYEILDSPPHTRKLAASRKAVQDAFITKPSAIKKGQRGNKTISSTKLRSGTYSPSPACRKQDEDKPDSHSAASPHGSIHNRQPKSKPRDTETVDWNEDLETNDKDPKNTSRLAKKKSTKSKSISAAESKKVRLAQANSDKKREVEGKRPPASLDQRKTRRAAALTANERIQGMAKLDVSVEEEEPEIQLSKRSIRTNVNQKEKRSVSLAPHERLGSVGKKLVSLVALNTSLDDRGPASRVTSALEKPMKAIHPLAPQADLQTIPPDQVVLPHNKEIFGNVMEGNQDSLHQDDVGTIGHVNQDSPLTGNRAFYLALGENLSPGDLGVLEVENSHFQDAMTFVAGNGFSGSKSPIHEDNRPGSAAVIFSKENRASEQRDDSHRNQDLESTEKIVQIAAVKSREPWADKLAGALFTVPKVLHVQTPLSATKMANQYEYAPQGTSETSTSRPMSKAVKSKMSTRGVVQNSMPHLLNRQGRGGDVDDIKVSNYGYESQVPIITRSPAVDTPPASAVVNPASSASIFQPSKVIQISSGAEDSSDEGFIHNPEVPNETRIKPVLNAAYDARAEVATSQSHIEPRTFAVEEAQEAKAPLLVTESKSEQRETMRLDNVETISTKATKNTPPKTRPGGSKPHKHTPDPNRKTNLISFSVKGPRNQGIASGQKLQSFAGTEQQLLGFSQTKKFQAIVPDDEDQDMGDVSVKDSEPVDTHITTLTEGRQAREKATGHNERRAVKLTSKLQKPTLTTKRNATLDSSSLGESIPRRGEGIKDGRVTKKSTRVTQAVSPPVVTAEPFVAVADMGYNTREEARRDQDEVSKLDSNTMPIKLPSAAVIRKKRRPSLATARSLDSAPRETKRQADETGIDVTDEVVLRKRRKLSSEIPSTKEIALGSVLQRNHTIQRDLSQRTGSQSMRVDLNGSPLPFPHSRHIDSSESRPRLTQDITRLTTTIRHGQGQENEGKRLNVEVQVAETTSPLRKYTRAPKRTTLGTSGNSKLQPSSSNGPSSIVDEMEPHHVGPTGKFINVETENVITSHDPPDPFTGMAQGRPNTFMQALRNTSDRGHKTLTKGPKVLNTHIRNASYFFIHGEAENEDDEEEDPEKTLVEPAWQEEHSESASRTSSTSENFHSGDRSPHGKHSGRDDRSAARDEWQEALQSHQRNTLDVLYDISHVSPRSPSTYITKL